MMRVGKVSAGERAAVQGLLQAEPYTNHLLAAKLSRDLDSELWGCSDEAGLHAAVAVGSALYPSRLQAECSRLLAARLAERARLVGSITGERGSVLGLWQELAPRWPVPARLIRPSQPLLILDLAVTPPPGSTVRKAVESDLASYTAAGAMMFAGEIEAAPPLRALQQRFRSSIRAGRSFAAVEDGKVYFKCDIGFVLDDIAHLQGVWLAPELRGQGRSRALLVGALALIQRDLAPRVSLYVNDFNTSALALYRSLGFTQVEEYATVFF